MIILTFDASKIIAIVIPVVLLLIIGALILFINRKRRGSSHSVTQIADDSLVGLIRSAVGGQDNIDNVSFKMTRLTITLKNTELFNEAAIKDQGIVVIAMEKKVTFVLGSKAEAVFNSLKK